MNPVCKEYGARSKLPDNLKQLFRAVAMRMTVPNVRLIAQVLLYAEGFKFAKEWGNKICEIYQLSKQLLSPQRHYDWGLRALKTVLNSSGKALREMKKRQEISGDIKTVELSLLLKALTEYENDSKRDDGDAKEAEDDGTFTEKLETAIHNAIESNHLQNAGNQFKKIMQLYEALSQRMGVELFKLLLVHLVVVKQH